MANDESSADEYRVFSDLIRSPMGAGNMLVYCPLSRSARLLSSQSYQLLQACWAFATLKEHASRICQELGLLPTQRSAVHTELETLAAAGLLVARRTLLGRGARRSTEAVRVTTVGIPTRDRPQSLHECLLSYLERGQQHRRNTEFLIVDDSARSETRDQNRQVLRELAARFQAPLTYAGPREREIYADELARETGLSREDVRFGLVNDEDFPVATGASRNALLLHTIGELLLQVDDDTLGQPVPVPGTRHGLALSSVFDPTDFWFFPAGIPLRPEEATQEDLLALHEQLLSRSTTDLLAASGEVVNLDAANASFFRHLEAGKDRVVVTSTGVVGDSGMGSPMSLLTLDGDSRVRLLESESNYRRSIANRQVFRAVTRPTVCESAYCMALNLGLDNRDILPPFLPIQRNQDGVFGAVLRSCGFGFFGFLPWGVPHQPPTARTADADTVWRRAARPMTGHLMQILISSSSSGPGSANSQSKLRILGASLEELGRCDANEFEEHVRLHVWNGLSRHMAHLETLLKRFGSQPGYWAEDVQRVLAGLREGLAERDFTVPWDLADAFGADRARTLFQRIVRRFGRLLQDWPALIQAARCLREQGIRLAVTA